MGLIGTGLTIFKVFSLSETGKPFWDDCVEQSWSMYCNNAYIHNYQKHGIEKDEFSSAFAQTEQIIHSYKSLSSHWFLTLTLFQWYLVLLSEFTWGI